MLSLSLLACDAELYHDLPERYVNEALLSLRQAGISADKRPSGRSSHGALYTLTVPRRQEDRALSRLQEQGLPGIEPRPVRSGKLAFLPSEARAEQLAQREQALIETLESLPQVNHARVHLAFAEPDPLLPTAQLRPTASVLLRVRGPLTTKPSELAELVPGRRAACFCRCSEVCAACSLRWRWRWRWCCGEVDGVTSHPQRPNMRCMRERVRSEPLRV